jgi:phosphate transport system permease protein
MAVGTGDLNYSQVISKDIELISIEKILENSGVFLTAEVSSDILNAARSKFYMETLGHSIKNWLVIILSIIGLVWTVTQAKLSFRARPRVEKMVLILLAAAATLAIFTSVGIVLSMIFEAIRFFGLHPWSDFFFGSTWAPSFSAGSELSILPLLWGTLYISFVALLVSVPIGLYAAIYLSEYASKTVRAFAKPLLEVLAGIPTIVYGLFALTTFGPFLRQIFGDGGFLGVEWMSDSRSVITAGVVMGMMLIPFVSSLSDDIINAVPQSLREGSYGLGATQSETVRNVILPAALPGIIGAVLLAASRAIGETMIVVLGAGAVAKFAGNPLEALTTITTRIVSQLTGDLEFDSAETLVAFALGLTLFAITLGLNVLALYIVRKYREQYE